MQSKSREGHITPTEDITLGGVNRASCRLGIDQELPQTNILALDLRARSFRLLDQVIFLFIQRLC